MRIGPTSNYGLIIPRADYINSIVRQGTISREAKKRLQWMDHYHKHGNARFTCRHFGISPQTFYRWKNRFDRYDLTTLEEQSRKPHNEIRYQFSARDVVAKFDGLRAYKSKTRVKAALFLDYLQKKFPFKIKAIQVDGGSEFKKHFEEECKRRDIMLFGLPPRSPKLNGHVERSNRTHRQEFYEKEKCH